MKVYQDSFITFLNYNFSKVLKMGGGQFPHTLALATPVLETIAAWTLKKVFYGEATGAVDPVIAGEKLLMTLNVRKIFLPLLPFFLASS